MDLLITIHQSGNETEDLKESQRLKRKKNRTQALVSSKLAGTGTLSVFKTGTRFITLEDGVGGGDILCVYEVVGGENGELLIRNIFSEDSSGCSHTNTRIITVDIDWLKENFVTLLTTEELSVCEGPESFTDENKGMLPVQHHSATSVVKGTRSNGSLGASELTRLSTLFSPESNFSLIGEVTDKHMVVLPTAYEKAYLYSLEEVPCCSLGNGFWFSLAYEKVLAEIFKKFYGKMVRIYYKGILYDNSSKTEAQSIEYPEEPITGVVGSIEKDCENPQVLILHNAMQAEKKIEKIPFKAFFTGFRLEVLPD